MKKNNILLAICSFIACVMYIAFVQHNLIMNFSVHALVWIIAQILFLATLFMCFVLENRTILLFFILLFGGVAFYAIPQSVYTFFPLLLSLWFVKSVEKNVRFTAIVPYCCGIVLCIIVGTFLVFRGNSPNIARVLPKLNIAVFITLAVIFVIQCVITLLLKSKEKNAQKLSNKKRHKQLENFKVIFYFSEALVLILNIAFYMNAPTEEALPVAFAVLKVVCAVYCVLKLYTLSGNEIALLKKLKKQWLD